MTEDLHKMQQKIDALDDHAVELYLFGCIERQFGRAKIQASDYTFNLTLPAGYRVLTPTVWIEAEVSNGGAGQYFWNRFVDFRLMTSDAIDAYETIGAMPQANSVRDCLRVFEPLEATLREIREQELGGEGFTKWMQTWDALDYRGDNPLFEYEDVMERFRVPWIRRNIEQFVFPKQA